MHLGHEWTKDDKGQQSQDSVKIEPSRTGVASSGLGAGKGRMAEIEVYAKMGKYGRQQCNPDGLSGPR
jgi:hypothetical protein